MQKSPPTWINQLKVIAWDLDGTLYPPNQELTDYISTQINVAVAQKQGLAQKKARQKFNERYRQFHSATKTLDSLGINGKQFFISIWEEHDLSPFIKPNPKLHAAFRKLKEKKLLRHFIHTNSNTLQSATKKLNLIGLNPDLFEKIITSVDVDYNKPDKRMFEALLKETKVEPDKILYVGDRELTDIEPAKKIGLRTALISAQNTSSAADISLKTAIDVIALLNHINV